MARIALHTGFAKVPAVETADGLWLFDTTPMLQWFEQRYPASPVLPDDPALRFVALLLEDYGDEWLRRPAMWWRWMPPVSPVTVGRRIALGIGAPRPLVPLLGAWFARRQRREWLWGDGMTRDNEGAVRDMLQREFEFLAARGRHDRFRDGGALRTAAQPGAPRDQGGAADRRPATQLSPIIVFENGDRPG